MKTRWYVIQHSSGLPIGNIYPMTHQEMLAFRRAQMKANTVFAENVICTDDTLLERGSIGIVGND